MLDTEVGYSQGTVPDPSYEDVCSGLTGHNEVVKVDIEHESSPQLLDYLIRGSIDVGAVAEEHYQEHYSTMEQQLSSMVPENQVKLKQFCLYR